ALAWGRGERLLALPALPTRPVALLIFPFGVSTAEAFGWLAESRETGTGSPMQAVLLQPERLRNWNGIASVAATDLEPMVCARHGELADGLELLAERVASRAGVARGEVIARMTGTGSTLFSIPVAGPLAPSLAGGVEWPGGGRVVLTET